MSIRAAAGRPVDGEQVQVGPPPRAVRNVRRRLLPSWCLKTTMAVTGALWAGFVTIHLFGNLKVFQGPEAFNAYAAWLRAVGYPLLPKESILWALRVVLVLALLAHVGSAAVLWVRARRARGRHPARLHGARSWGAWLMPLTGVVLLAFLVVHLLDLTLGVQPAAPEGFVPAAEGATHAYENLVASFQRPASAWFYVATMLLLALHLAKGFTTMAADVGVMGRRWRAVVTVAGGLLAVAVLLGNAVIPVLVQVGVLA